MFELASDISSLWQGKSLTTKTTQKSEAPLDN